MRVSTAIALAFFVWAPGALCSAQTQAPPNFQYFFTATNSAFEAYIDESATTVDADLNKLVAVKLTRFSEAFRMWIKDNFPGGETAEYALDSYSIDCEARTVGEHQLVWYDASGTELTDYDFGGRMTSPIGYSLKDNLMKKVCGLQ